MESDDTTRRDPHWVTHDASGVESTASPPDAVQNPLVGGRVTHDASGIESTASHQDAAHDPLVGGRLNHDAFGVESQASNQDAAQNPPVRGRASPMLRGGPWRESQWRQAIEEIIGGITRLPHLRRHQHDVRDVVGLPAACRSYYQKVEEILDLMYKYLEFGHHHGDRNRQSSIPHRRIIQNLRRRDNPLVLMIGRGEEHQFLLDSRMFRNSERYYASSFTNADISFLQHFCDGNLPKRLESALGVAVDCIKVDAECRHTGAEPLAVRHVEDLSSEVLGQILYFHYCRKFSLQAGLESRIEELGATVNNMLTVEDDLRAQNARLLDSLRRAEQQAETAEHELEAIVNDILTVQDDLRAQNARLLDSLRRAELEAENAEDELEAERMLRRRAEASRGRTVRRAEHRLRDEYARQHDEWYHDLRNYRTDREQYGPAFEDSVEAPGRASGDDRSWLDLRRETNELCTDLETAGNAQADLQADLSRVRRQRNHALRERDNLQGQLWQAHAYYNPYYHHIGWLLPR